MQPFQFSLSAMQAWQRCEQQYHYSYVRGLRPKVKDIAPQTGVLLHSYLEGYYRLIREKHRPEDAHRGALDLAHTDNDKDIRAAKATAHLVGDHEAMALLDDIFPKVERIALRYFKTRGRSDAERYDVLEVERYLKLELAPGITSTSVVDLILHERERDLLWLVEHKSTANVPTSDVRLRDFQTLLYSEVVKYTLGLHIDGILWNYIRTKEPTVPHLLKGRGKDGPQPGKRVSRADNIDTTWDVYLDAVKEADDNPFFYQDMRERLEGREETVFFPRYEHVVVADPILLMRDYAEVSMRARAAVQRWEHGFGQPTRSLRRDCKFCQFSRLCEATITGGDAETLIPLHYRQRGESRDSDADLAELTELANAAAD